MNKLKFEDSTLDVLTKMSEGNPGAINVLLMILRDGERIDPDAGDGVFAILHLDSYNIYGSRIWMLYKDVCNCNISLMICLLRGCQLGFVKESSLCHAIDNYSEGIDIDEICKKVLDFLPQFQLDKNVDG